MKAEFYFDCHKYICSLVQVDFVKELKIKNHQGFVLAVKQGQKIGLLGKSRHNAKQVDVSKPHFYNVIKAAMSALELETKNEVILERNRTLADAEEMIQQQNREIRVLNEQLRILAERVEELLASQQPLPMEIVDNQIIESEVSQEVDDCSASEADLSTPETENESRETEISQNIKQLAVQLIEHQPQSSEFEEVEEAEISGINDEEEIVDSQVGEPEEDCIEVKLPVGDRQIKQLPKRASNRKMRKKY
ncbi:MULTISPECIES: hypothetical protein [unclassified Microcoleus]|uniref:hypothetical protein n=1 Tax=unclassified Microcoleus TaxID=2642155 RepID=UPI002FCF6628